METDTNYDFGCLMRKVNRVSDKGTYLADRGMEWIPRLFDLQGIDLVDLIDWSKARATNDNTRYAFLQFNCGDTSQAIYSFRTWTEVKSELRSMLMQYYTSLGISEQASAEWFRSSGSMERVRDMVGLGAYACLRIPLLGQGDIFIAVTD